MRTVEKSASLTARYLPCHYIVGLEIPTLLCWSRKHSYQKKTTVWCSLTGSFWCPPQRTRRWPRRYRLSKLSYTRWRTAFNCIHTLSFWNRGVQVFYTLITDTCLCNDYYTISHMTQHFTHPGEKFCTWVSVNMSAQCECAIILGYF